MKHSFSGLITATGFYHVPFLGAMKKEKIPIKSTHHLDFRDIFYREGTGLMGSGCPPVEWAHSRGKLEPSTCC